MAMFNSALSYNTNYFVNCVRTGMHQETDKILNILKTKECLTIIEYVIKSHKFARF